MLAVRVGRVGELRQVIAFLLVVTSFASGAASLVLPDGEPPPAGGERPAGAAKTAFVSIALVSTVPDASEMPQRCLAETDVCTAPDGSPHEIATVPAGPGGALAPGYARAEAVAFLWMDANGDMLVQRAERDGRAEVLAGRSVVVSPGAAGWPPGSAVVRDYESVWTQRVTPLSGTAPVALALDPLTTHAGNHRSGSVDALLLPTGSAGGLAATMPGGASIAWTEPSGSYSATFAASWP